MRSLIEASAQATGVEPDGDGNAHHRVIADHLRSTSFLVAEGVMPSNEGRGYVLRRIMRRAMRHAHLLGAKDPVMHRLVPALVAQMGQAFPELSQGQSLIEETLELEETRFKATLDRGLSLLEAEAADLGEQKAKARAAWSGTDQAADDLVWFEVAEKVAETEFLGYASEQVEAQVLALVAEGKLVSKLEAGSTGAVVLNQTPFYAEAGGQVGDTGALSGEGLKATVTGTQRRAGLIVQNVTIEEGSLSTDEFVEARVLHERRTAIRSNHSATHLLHEALRGALGDHVAQRGSLVSPDRLRFDFAHNKAMSAEEISGVEACGLDGDFGRQWSWG